MSSFPLPVVLFACAIAYALPRDDSNSPTNSSVARSPSFNSEHSTCNLEFSELSGSKCEGSHIVYSIISGSLIINSVIDALYGNTKVQIIPPVLAQYFFNRITNSEIVSSTVSISRYCYGSQGGDNSTIYLSRISQSQVYRSKIISSNLTRKSVSCSSLVSLSNLDEGSTGVNSVIKRLRSTRSKVINSDIEKAYLHLATVENSGVYGSHIVDSTIENSKVFSGSESHGSLVQNSEISKKSKVIVSQIINSKVVNSVLTDCVVMNSDVVGKTLNSVKIINDMIF